MKKFAIHLKKFINSVLAITALVVIYFFVVLPIGILMKLLRRDRMRSKKKVIDTYWTEVPKNEDSYEQQF